MFRHESMNRDRDRLSGSVSIAVPIGWQVIGFLIAVIVAAALAFLALGSYDRVETVSGKIAPDSGVSEIIASRPGIVTSIDVAEGQDVVPGQVLATVRVDEDGSAERSPGEQAQAAIAAQDESLRAQAAAARRIALEQGSQLAAQNAGYEAEIVQLEGQAAEQDRLIASAQLDLDRAREVSQRGFISRRDLQAREDVLTTRRQALAQIRQLIASKRAAVAANRQAAIVASSQAGAQLSSLEATRAQVAQQAATIRGSLSYTLKAPRAGRVTTLLLKPGQRVQAQEQIMSVVPEGSVLTAELAVPSAAIGFIDRGQQVRIAIDAFPYQKFGTIDGIVREVPSNAITISDGQGGARTIYPVIVRLNGNAMEAYGRPLRIVPGMTLTARVRTQRQNLFEWLFEPFFAVGRR